MADVYLKMSYTLNVADNEMRLICLGLAGKLIRLADILEAKALNERILNSQQIRLNEKLAANGDRLMKVEEERMVSVAKAVVPPHELCPGPGNVNCLPCILPRGHKGKHVFDHEQGAANVDPT